MLRLVALFLTVLGAKFATAAASSAECQGTECQDETSLVQVKASIKRHTDDEDDGPSGSKDVSLFFKNKEDLIAGLREAGDCLTPGKFDDHGKYPACATGATADPEHKGGVCIKCIHAQWATKNSGAGFDCCKAMTADQIKIAPLCGVCLRAKKGGLAGPANKGNADQSQFTKCAKYYCEAGPSSTVSTAALKNIAHWCSPSETKNDGPGPVQNMIGIVANDPKKTSLEAFLTAESADIKTISTSQGHNITGTKTSSDMAQCVTKGKKADFHTFSGPWGGDAQLAGLLALQKTDTKHKYIDALIFFNEEQEAHKEDILSLVAVMHATMDKSKLAFTPSVAKTLVTSLKR